MNAATPPGSWSRQSLCPVRRYTFPLLTAVFVHFGWCGDRESLSGRGWACSAAGFAGIVLVVAPWTGNDWTLDTLWGVLLTLGSALCWAVQAIVIRNTRASVHWLQVIFSPFCPCF